MGGEGLGLFQGVVDVVDEDVFEGDELFFSGLPVGAGVEQIVEGVFAVDGHDLRPHLVGGAVEGNSEPDLQGKIGELANLRDESARGDGDVTCAKADAPRGVDDAKGAREVFKVGQRLAHAHENDILNAFAGEGLGLEDLIDDFAGVEVTGPAVESAGAKFTSVSATDLAGDAEGAATGGFAKFGRGGRDENGFDETSVVELIKEFAGGVVGTGFKNDGRAVETKAGGEFAAQRDGKIGHSFQGDDAFGVDPIENLCGAKRRFVLGSQPVLKCAQGLGFKMGKKRCHKSSSKS